MAEEYASNLAIREISDHIPRRLPNLIETKGTEFRSAFPYSAGQVGVPKIRNATRAVTLSRLFHEGRSILAENEKAVRAHANVFTLVLSPSYNYLPLPPADSPL